LSDTHAPHDLPDLPARPDEAHKGSFGTVVVIGGSHEMLGAPALAARAALRAGAGLARIATQPELIAPILIIEPSATAISFAYTDGRGPAAELERRIAQNDVLVIGPGMGVDRPQCELIEQMLRQPRPVVLDADGLNNLAELRDAPLAPRCPLVMTPHPGEFRRLAEAGDLHADPIDPDKRPDAAAEMARKYNAVVVLKGHRTVISDGKQTHTNTTGNPALATAGTGDVLSGTIGSLIAQGMGLYDAAVLGAYLHGLAGDLWSEQHGAVGLIARDLADLLPCAMQRCRCQKPVTGDHG